MSVDNSEFLIAQAQLAADFFSALYGVWFDRCLERDMITENGTSSDETSEESHAHHDWWI